MNDRPICCEPFENMLQTFGWFNIEGEEEILLMPYIEANGQKWRINKCPSCGENVRAISITKQQYLNSIK